MVKVGDTVTRTAYGLAVTGVVGMVAANGDLYTQEGGYLGQRDEVTVVKSAPVPEPTGLGAVVRTKEGTLWIRAETDPRDDLPWRTADIVGDWGRWSDLDEPTVLSQGWTEEG